jgi:hypothetical protein
MRQQRETQHSVQETGRLTTHSRKAALAAAPIPRAAAQELLLLASAQRDVLIAKVQEIQPLLVRLLISQKNQLVTFCLVSNWLSDVYKSVAKCDNTFRGQAPAASAMLGTQLRVWECGFCQFWITFAERCRNSDSHIWVQSMLLIARTPMA